MPTLFLRRIKFPHIETKEDRLNISAVNMSNCGHAQKCSQSLLSRPGNGASEALCLEVPQLLHEVGALHERHVGEVKVAQDLAEGAAFKSLFY